MTGHIPVNESKLCRRLPVGLDFEKLLRLLDPFQRDFASRRNRELVFSMIRSEMAHGREAGVDADANSKLHIMAAGTPDFRQGANGCLHLDGHCHAAILAIQDLLDQVRWSEALQRSRLFDTGDFGAHTILQFVIPFLQLFCLNLDSFTTRFENKEV